MYEEKVSSITVPASGDLSANQYMVVAIDSNGQAALANAAAIPAGVLMNTPESAGEAATIAIGGVVKVRSSAAVAAGAAVGVAATAGKIDDAGTTTDIGVALAAAGGADDYVPVLLKL